MHSSGSLIKTCLEGVKFFAEEQTLNAKYDNDYIVRQVMGPAIAEVLSRINQTQDNPLLLHHAITVTSGLEFVVLPPYIQEVWWLVEFDEDGNLKTDWRPMNRRHPCGPNWVLEGNMLRFMPKATWTGTLYLGYVPNGNAQMHYSSGTVQTTGSSTSMLLATTPTLGLLDRLDNSYAGSMFRLLGANKAWEERVIESFDQSPPSTPTVTLRKAALASASAASGQMRTESADCHSGTAAISARVSPSIVVALGSKSRAANASIMAPRGVSTRVVSPACGTSSDAPRISVGWLIVMPTAPASCPSASSSAAATLRTAPVAPGVTPEMRTTSGGSRRRSGFGPVSGEKPTGMAGAFCREISATWIISAPMVSGSSSVREACTCASPRLANFPT